MVPEVAPRGPEQAGDVQAEPEPDEVEALLQVEDDKHHDQEGDGESGEEAVDDDKAVEAEPKASVPRPRMTQAGAIAGNPLDLRPWSAEVTSD